MLLRFKAERLVGERVKSEWCRKSGFVITDLYYN